MASKRLWTAWRMEYIKSLKKDPSACIFCEALASGSDRDSLVLFRGRTCVLMLNLYPYNPGHLMVAPNRHVASLAALATEEGTELMELAALGEKILAATHNPQGFNLGVNLGNAPALEFRITFICIWCRAGPVTPILCQ